MIDWKTTFLAWIQKINQPIMGILGAGCHMDRKLWTYFEDTPFTDLYLQHCSPLTVAKTSLKIFINSIIYGYATK